LRQLGLSLAWRLAPSSWCDNYHTSLSKRIFYSREAELIGTDGEPDTSYPKLRCACDDMIGFVNRQKLEEIGEVYNRARHWFDAEFHLYASLQGLLSRFYRYNKDDGQPDLRQLKAKMAAAHPDRGGSNEAFIAARERYVTARRANRNDPPEAA
jgi:hypothetical protein